LLNESSIRRRSRWWNIGLPGISGIEGTRILKQRHPDVQVIILTVYYDDDRLFQALCAGASGYLLKNTTPARLLECIREVAQGGAPVSPELARRVINLFQRIQPPSRAEQELTPHEMRILKLLVEGHNYKTAAAELGLSVNTISFHVRRIYEKLQVHSKSEAVAKALRANLVSLTCSGCAGDSAGAVTVLQNHLFASEGFVWIAGGETGEPVPYFSIERVFML
jgi:DNA-binding NarL/FixJ family response regulator